MESGTKYDKDSPSSRYQNDDMSPLDIMIDGNKKNKDFESSRRRRAGSSREDLYEDLNGSIPDDPINSAARQRQLSWKRVVLLIVAITVHNIPGSSRHREYLVLFKLHNCACMRHGII